MCFHLIRNLESLFERPHSLGSTREFVLGSGKPLVEIGYARRRYHKKGAV